MKVAILTDIHGNVPALQAVLADMDFRGDIEYTFCLGDMIGIGLYSNEVIEMLYSREHMIAISGNHEEAVLSLLQHKGPLEGHKGIAEHHEWIGQHLSAESIKRIQALPKFVEKEVERRRFLLTHYHISNDKLDVIDKEPSGAKLDAKYQGTAHDLVCFGHHHILHYYKTDQRIYMNPGALGCNDLAIARYGIVDLQEGKVDVKFIGVPYDNREYLQSYERLNVPDRAFILKAFHGNQLEREYGGE